MLVNNHTVYKENPNEEEMDLVSDEVSYAEGSHVETIGDNSIVFGCTETIINYKAD